MSTASFDLIVESIDRKQRPASPSSFLRSFRPGNRHFIGVQIACKSRPAYGRLSRPFRSSYVRLRGCRSHDRLPSSINDIDRRVWNRRSI